MEARSRSRTRNWAPASRRQSSHRLLYVALILPAVVFGAGALGGPHVARPNAAAPAADPLVTRSPVRASPTTISSVVRLGDGAPPDAICENELYQCPALAGQSQVTLSVQAGVKGHNASQAVQLLFLLETTPYDGVYSPTAGVPGPTRAPTLGRAPRRCVTSRTWFRSSPRTQARSPRHFNRST